VPWLSDKPLYEAFGSRALFHASYGGADFGECQQAVQRVGDGGADGWHREWSAAADRLMEVADRSSAAGHPVSAREAYLRATTYYRTGYYPLFGRPVDERLAAAFAREEAAFAKAGPLWDWPVELVEIPFEDGVTLPGVMVLAGEGAEPRATIVHVNGYDSNVHEMFVAHVPAAVSRGYNLLLFDGPGQGRNLVRDGLPMRPDWENVVRPVLDYALARPEVDERRVVLAGWSFGGFLAPRAACFEDRIAALWADPGQWDQSDAILPRLPLSDQEKARFPDVEESKIARVEEYLRGPDADPTLSWRLIQRGLWVHGKASLFDYFAEMLHFELSPVAANISCPTLLTAAEDDPIAAGAPKLLDAISSDRKALIRFTQSEGAGGHCEGAGRRLFYQRCYDWLDETLAHAA
jgi:pimeloyl-ACP methyl ester carboxylesterase